MRIVSYNILDGGEGRADPLAEVIESQNPDIVVLVEADNPLVTERIAKRLSMDVVVGQGKRHAAAILSRWTIIESINHGLLREELSNSMLEATIADSGGMLWALAAVHLHPRAGDADETQRELEVGAILDIFASHRAQGRPHILAGDFNANSPVQEINPEECKPRTREEFIQNGGELPRRAIQKILSAGYIDSLQAFAGAAAARIGSFTTQFPGQRVDYIFTHGISSARFSKAKIEDDRLAQFASDHFPAYLQID